MKILAALIVLFGVGSAQAAIRMNTDCGGFGPDLQRLVVQETGLEDFVVLGYQTMGSTKDLGIKGCERITRQGTSIYCGKTLIGKTGRTGMDRQKNLMLASLSLNRDLQAQIVGSCAPEKKKPLTVVINN